VVSEKREVMRFFIDLAEKGMIPDALIRFGIRALDRKRLSEEARKEVEDGETGVSRFIQSMRESPIAQQVEKPKEQHYELPPAFFQKVLGKRMKYSSCYWPPSVKTLDEAEEAMLALSCERAQVEDGMDVLDLGCGWGSSSLWVAEKYPKCRVLAVSNSLPQGEFIRARARDLSLSNVDVKTADMNGFDTSRRFDRILSVEMFEHMRNWPGLLGRIGGWLNKDGKLFIHIFTHRRFSYLFETEGADNWMGQHFFTAGMMPSDSLLPCYQEHLVLEEHWQVSGVHYQKTAEAWLRRMDTQASEIMRLFREVYGPAEARRWFQRWRIFFMACAELWGFRGGKEWLVSHYRFRKRFG
jgi:cyclopropane-fatty-acyl-phospholipid synthase